MAPKTGTRSAKWSIGPRGDLIHFSRDGGGGGLTDYGTRDPTDIVDLDRPRHTGVMMLILFSGAGS